MSGNIGYGTHKDLSSFLVREFQPKYLSVNAASTRHSFNTYVGAILRLPLGLQSDGQD